MITHEQLKHWFTYHPPEGDQAVTYQKIREAAHEFAKVLLDNTPESADQTAAIRKVWEAQATANRAIACKGR